MKAKKIFRTIEMGMLLALLAFAAVSCGNNSNAGQNNDMAGEQTGVGNDNQTGNQNGAVNGNQTGNPAGNQTGNPNGKQKKNETANPNRSQTTNQSNNQGNTTAGTTTNGTGNHNGLGNLTTETEDIDYVKVFCWKDDMTPLGEAEIINIQ